MIRVHFATEAYLCDSQEEAARNKTTKILGCSCGTADDTPSNHTRCQVPTGSDQAENHIARNYSLLVQFRILHEIE